MQRRHFFLYSSKLSFLRLNVWISSLYFDFYKQIRIKHFLDVNQKGQKSLEMIKMLNFLITQPEHWRSFNGMRLARFQSFTH